MILADHTISIERPIDEVFNYIANHENYAQWFPGVISISSSDKLPHGTLGKTYQERVKLPTGRTRLIEIPVVQSKPQELFVTEGKFPPLHPRMEVRLRQLAQNQTELRWIFSSRAQSALGRLVVRALGKRDVLKRSTQGMAALKEILERG